MSVYDANATAAVSTIQAWHTINAITVSDAKLAFFHHKTFTFYKIARKVSFFVDGKVSTASFLQLSYCMLCLTQFYIKLFEDIFGVVTGHRLVSSTFA
jgi:hypothetical protein